MNGDLGLIRLLLKEYEGEELNPELSGYSEKAQLHHLELMEETGLIVAELPTGGEDRVGNTAIMRLTTAGHDFLEDCRSDRVWKAFQEVNAASGGNLSLPNAIELLKALAKDMG